MSEKSKTLRVSLNLRKRAGRKYMAQEAIKHIRKQVQKHTHAGLDKIKVSRGINEAIWKNGSFSIPTRLDIEILEDKAGVHAFLQESKEKDAYLALQKIQEKEKTKKTEEKKKEEGKTKEEKKEEAEEKEEQEKRLEEKRLKESMVQKSEYT